MEDEPLCGNCFKPVVEGKESFLEGRQVAMGAPTKPKPMSIKDAAKDALQVQDACNVSGVVLGFARAMEAVNAERWRLEAAGVPTGSDFVRHHPVVILWVNKLEDMVYSNSSLTRYSRAYEACNRLATARTSTPRGRSRSPARRSPNTVQANRNSGGPCA